MLRIRFLAPALLLLATAAYAATVIFEGVRHSSIGNATLELQGDDTNQVLVVGNIGNDGFPADGVRLEPQASDVQATEIQIEYMIPESETWTLIHESLDSQGIIVVTAKFDSTRSFPVSWSADFTGAGFTHYKVEYLFGNTPIHVDDNIPAGSTACSVKVVPDRVKVIAPPDPQFEGEYFTTSAQHKFRDGTTGYVTDIQFQGRNANPAPGPGFTPASPRLPNAPTAASTAPATTPTAPPTAPTAPTAPATTALIQNVALVAEGMSQFTIKDEVYIAPVTGVGDTPAPGPAVFASPNPFRADARIGFVLSAEGAVTVQVLDVRGRLVREWPRQRFPAGVQSLVWDGRDAAGRPVGSGIYFTQLVIEDQGKRSRKTVRLLRL